MPQDFIKPSVYVVHLKNMVRRDYERILRFSEETRQAIGNHLRGLFGRVVAGQVVGTHAFNGAHFTWQTHSRTIEIGEVLVYFVQDRSASICLSQGVHTLAIDVAHGGTGFSSGMISEVYVDSAVNDANRGRLLANLAFHECMHNKLDAHPQLKVMNDIHPTGGLARDLPPITSDTQLTDQNITDMRSGIGINIPQFIGRL